VAKTDITRREWLERIRQHIICLSATIMHLLGGWYSLTDEARQEQAEMILAEMRTILTMIQSRHLFSSEENG